MAAARQQLEDEKHYRVTLNRVVRLVDPNGGPDQFFRPKDDVRAKGKVLYDIFPEDAIVKIEEV